MNVMESADELLKLLNAHQTKMPFGLRASEVQILGGKRRKDARQRRPTADKPHKDGDWILVRLEDSRVASVGGPPSRMPMPAEHANAQANGSAMDQAQCLQALRRAETAPGHSFVALKWFRDSYLPRQGFAWAESPEARDAALREITARGWARVEKIPNPRNPGFDTSALRVQMDSQEVRNILGEEESRGWGFPRIKVQGESGTEILRKMRDGRY